MAQAVQDRVPGAEASARPGEQVRLRWRDELVTVLLGTWLMVGLFVDGWAHNTLSELETFFTPWHALFYSGFAVTAAWIGWQVIRAQESGRRGLSAVPLGYGLALVGCVIFAVGGAGDYLWHSAFGIEEDLEALFSPTHLLLFVGIALILSAPLRAAWSADPPGAAPRFREFLPTLLSATLTTALVAFMFMFLSSYFEAGASVTLSAEAAAADRGDGWLPYLQMVHTMSGVFATNLILLAPMLLLARRWTLPFGTATTIIGTAALLTAAINEIPAPSLPLAAIVSGLVIDAGLRWLRPSAERPAAYWAAGLAIPLVLWGTWFAAIASFEGGVGWNVEFWTGTIMWASIVGGLLAFLMLPPRVPATTAGP